MSAPGTGTVTDAKSGGSPRSVVRTLGAMVGEALALVFLEPIREGRLRTAGWPEGLRAIAGLGLAGLLVGAGVVVGAGPIRRHGELAVGLGGDLIFPRWTMPVLIVLTVLTLALLHAASLHLAPWLRVVGLLLVVLALLSAVLDPVDDGLAANVVSWVGCGLLVVLTAVRWRFAFRWWEFAASFAVIGGTFGVVLRLVAQDSQPVGFDTGPLALTTTVQFISVLAVPFTFVAGLAFAQLATLLAHRVGDVVDERVRPAIAVGAVVAVVAAADVLLAVRHLREPTASGRSHAAEWVASGVLLAVALLVALVVVARAAPPSGRGLDVLEGAVSTLALPVAVLATVTVVPNLLVSRVDTQLLRLAGLDHLVLDDVSSWFSRSWVVTATRVGLGVGLVAWAAWRRRRSPLPALLAAAVGVTLVVTFARRLTRGLVDLPWTSESLTDVASCVAVLVLLGLAVTGRLTRPRLVALGIALGLSLVFSVRSTFDAPFVALLGLGATAAVFLGVLWASLTDADDANGDSPRWPRPARVLLFLANAMLAMTTLAFVSVATTSDLSIDVSEFATLGDDYLGTGLLLAAYAVLARELLTGRPVDNGAVVTDEMAPDPPS